MILDADTGLYCVFGRPVSHSLSPRMHNALFRHYRLNAVYLAFEPPSIAEAVSAMRALSMPGASVTIPFKEAVLPLLDRIDPLAAEIGAVNTIRNQSGILTGYNTDGEGALDALRRQGVETASARALVIGNGGSARAIAFTLMREGVPVTIAGRNPERISALAAALSRGPQRAACLVIPELTPEITAEFDIVINTTPVGMEPDVEGCPIDPALIHPHHAVLDIIYAPEQTRLVGAALAAGCRIAYGKDMLVCQGARQFTIWTGLEAPLDVLYGAITRAIHG